MTKTEQQNQTQNNEQQNHLTVFESFQNNSGSGIIVPPIPFNLRNNGQCGRWVLEEQEYESSLKMFIFKNALFHGSLGKTKMVDWMQLWILPIDSNLPKNIVMTTYVKKASNI